MILSHARCFIFVKTLKTAGTSIEVALSSLCGPEDVITPIGSEEFERAPGAQNYIRGSGARETREDGLPAPLKDRDFYNHMPLAKIARYAGDEMVKRFCKIAFVRNPWDRQVSQFYFQRHKGLGQADFAEWIGGVRPMAVMAMLRLNGALGVDFVGRFESLEADFERVCRQLGAEPPPLPALKSSIRPKGHYRDYYNARSRDRVAEMYAEEIAAFGYSF